MSTRETVFIEVSDMETYEDWDMGGGYGGCDQLFYDDGIVVKKEDEEKFRSHVKDFENWNE